MNNQGSSNIGAAARREDEAAAGEAGEDRLSNLPGGILLNILERVDTRDALRTCILSKQMLQLLALLSQFDINIGSRVRHHDTASRGFTTGHIARYNKAVATVTEKILFAQNIWIHVGKLRINAMQNVADRHQVEATTCDMLGELPVDILLNISPRALHELCLRTRRNPNINAMQNVADRHQAEAAAREARGDKLSQLPGDILLNISQRALHGIYLRTRMSYNINAMKNAIACREAEAAAGDRLGELPDDILLDILERVDTLDALRTCILSKRLLQLPSMLSRFDINIASLMQHHDKASHGYLNITHVARYNNALAGVTEKILCVRSPKIPIIHKLRVRCYLRPDECLPITRAFASTMATQKVNYAEFVSLVEKPFSKCTPEDLVCYAKRFNTCLGDCPAAFAGLTRLWLCNMRFGELDIPNILSTCKRLEHLRLSRCDAGLRSVLLLEHDQLVEVIVERGHFEAVHLYRLPKVQRMTCAGWLFPVPLVFGYVPQLSMLSLVQRGIRLTRNLQLSQLLANVPSISELHLDFRSEKIWVVPECPKLIAPVLGKLESVYLDNLREGCDIAWTSFILEAAPCLRELCITVWDHWCEMVTDQDARRKLGYCEKANVEWQPSVPGLKHKNLVKLTIHGFQPNENMVRYVRNIMKVAVNMGEISLHDRKACKRCGDLDASIKVCPSTYPTTSEEKDMLRVEMTTELGMENSPAVIHFRS